MTRLRRFRYGVQVNSLGLTENQPENNMQRIILEMLAVTLSKRHREHPDDALRVFSGWFSVRPSEFTCTP